MLLEWKKNRCLKSAVQHSMTSEEKKGEFQSQHDITMYTCMNFYALSPETEKFHQDIVAQSDCRDVKSLQIDGLI